MLLFASLSLLCRLVQAQSSNACNNSPSLCSRSYASITHLGAHDSAFVSNSSNSFTISGNQYLTSTAQLDAGVRLLTTQIHTKDATDIELRLCHSDCNLYDAGSMIDWLSSIKSWLDANPNEVVTILLVNSVAASASRLDASFQASGIVPYAYMPASKGPQQQWPTLGDMIRANTRLVTYIADLPDNTGAPYLMDQFSYTFENPFEVTLPSNFSCMPERPPSLAGQPSTALSSGRLFLMNHFLGQKQLLSIVSPDRANASNTNSPDTNLIGSLGREMSTCARTYGRAPTYVLVDWFNVGPAIASVDSWNNVTSPVGRKVPAQTESGTSGSSSGSRNGACPHNMAVGLLTVMVFSLLFST